MRTAIGIDLGGTNIKGVLVSDIGEVLAETSAPTNDGLPAIDGVPAFAVSVRAVAKELSDGRSVDAIGLAAPGLAAKDGRSIAFMPGRMKGLENLDWTTLLERKETVPVLNDAQAALLGEVWIGAARGANDAMLLTLGTGVGGAVLSGGRLLKGALGRAGHVGHITVNADGPLDIVNTPGSLEDAIGQCSLKQRTGGRYSSTRELVAAAIKGDDRAVSVWQRSVYQLACGVASLVNVLDPEVVIIGGGIAQAGEALFGPLEKYLARVEWRPRGSAVRVVAAGLGERAGALGAAWNSLNHRAH